MNAHDVRPVLDIDTTDLRARLFDLCERRQMVAVRFRIPLRGGAERMGLVVGIVAAVDTHARIVLNAGADRYNVQLSDLLSVIELT